MIRFLSFRRNDSLGLIVSLCLLLRRMFLFPDFQLYNEVLSLLANFLLFHEIDTYGLVCLQVGDTPGTPSSAITSSDYFLIPAAIPIRRTSYRFRFISPHLPCTVLLLPLTFTFLPLSYLDRPGDKTLDSIVYLQSRVHGLQKARVRCQTTYPNELCFYLCMGLSVGL